MLLSEMAQVCKEFATEKRNEGVKIVFRQLSLSRYVEQGQGYIMWNRREERRASLLSLSIEDFSFRIERMILQPHCQLFLEMWWFSVSREMHMIVVQDLFIQWLLFKKRLRWWVTWCLGCLFMTNCSMVFSFLYVQENSSEGFSCLKHLCKFLGRLGLLGIQLLVFVE